MKMRWLAAGITAVLITGGAATLAQRVITQKTRGVLPTKNDAAHADSRSITSKVELIGHDKSVTVTFTPVKSPSQHLAPEPTPSGEAVTAAPSLPQVVEPPLVLGSNDPTPGLPVVVTSAVETVALPVEAPPATESPSPASPVAAPTDQAISPATVPPAGGETVAEPTTLQGVQAKTDPVDSVDAFVERNRKEAESAIETLTAEAANLKIRLAKVETALTRWQTFSHALNSDQTTSQPSVPGGSKPNWKHTATDSEAKSANPRAVGENPEPSPELAPNPHPPEAQTIPPVPSPSEAPPSTPSEPVPATTPPIEPPAPPTEPKI